MKLTMRPSQLNTPEVKPSLEMLLRMESRMMSNSFSGRVVGVRFSASMKSPSDTAPGSSPGGCRSFAAFSIRSGLTGASPAIPPIPYDNPGTSSASLSTLSPSGLWLEPVIQAESTCLDVVESCREVVDGIALPDGKEAPDSAKSPTAMCTLNDISRKMMLSGQLGNDASKNPPAYNSLNGEDDRWESSPELHLACSEESKNEFGDSEKPQPEMLINPPDQRVDQYIDINPRQYQSTAG
ncbi:hypothetical protein BGZ61DRAFT_469842 [Ilyonectria robusta]|uniref:uncharacterized protein n=1 Tax=Ilyonectria robusta TaxID=1079257 RepID=UPI001E8D1F01|nr:uncharacterized protein BGZ61DRAFT_469842 [Ilyonectria robusta]KAH8648098.1 hypothetical protein BGZ61DRAFT_469842 [Ilyonectria robusta]